ncbi:endophilin-B1-like isoform X2 [Dysidea avara]|uniref:endophilin-B1-like isoform X2 n=1 Tax=Dysidea avara TaxID=196820 RepID=UPI003321FA48
MRTCEKAKACEYRESETCDQRDTEDTESTAQKKGHDNFINSLKKFLEDDVLKAVHECKMLETMRVELDTASAKLKKTTSEERKQTAEARLHQLKQNFDGQAKKTRDVLIVIVINHATHYDDLNSIIAAQKNFYQNYVKGITGSREIKVIWNYTAQRDDEMTIEVGQKGIATTRSDDRYFMVEINGKCGRVPGTCIQINNQLITDVELENGVEIKIVRDYTAKDVNKELTVKTGQVGNGSKDPDGTYYQVEIGRESGRVPASCVQEVSKK